MLRGNLVESDTSTYEYCILTVLMTSKLFQNPDCSLGITAVMSGLQESQPHVQTAGHDHNSLTSPPRLTGRACVTCARGDTDRLSSHARVLPEPAKEAYKSSSSMSEHFLIHLDQKCHGSLPNFLAYGTPSSHPCKQRLGCLLGLHWAPSQTIWVEGERPFLPPSWLFSA